MTAGFDRQAARIALDLCRDMPVRPRHCVPVPTNRAKPFGTFLARLEDGDGQVLAYAKRYHGAQADARRDSEVDGLERAARAGLIGPHLLGQARAWHMVAMGVVPGAPLAAYLAAHPGDRATLLRQSGTWLAGFHGMARQAPFDLAPFDLAPDLRRLHDFAREVPRGQRIITHFSLYQSLLDALWRLRDPLRQRPLWQAGLHGDASPANVMAGPDGVGMVDFEYARPGPVLDDIATLAVRLQLAAPAPDGGGISADLAALAKGYGRGGVGGPGLRAMLLRRLAWIALEFDAPFDALPPGRAAAARRLGDLGAALLGDGADQTL